MKKISILLIATAFCTLAPHVLSGMNRPGHPDTSLTSFPQLEKIYGRKRSPSKPNRPQQRDPRSTPALPPIKLKKTVALSPITETQLKIVVAPPADTQSSSQLTHSLTSDNNRPTNSATHLMVPENPSTLFARAMIIYAQNPAEARPLLEAFVQYYPNDVNTSSAASYLAFMSNRPAQKMRLLHQALQSNNQLITDDIASLFQERADLLMSPHYTSAMNAPRALDDYARSLVLLVNPEYNPSDALLMNPENNSSNIFNYSWTTLTGHTRQALLKLSKDPSIMTDKIERILWKMLPLYAYAYSNHFMIHNSEMHQLCGHLLTKEATSDATCARWFEHLRHSLDTLSAESPSTTDGNIKGWIKHYFLNNQFNKKIVIKKSPEKATADYKEMIGKGRLYDLSYDTDSAGNKIINKKWFSERFKYCRTLDHNLQARLALITAMALAPNALITGKKSSLGKPRDKAINKYRYKIWEYLEEELKISRGHYVNEATYDTAPYSALSYRLPHPAPSQEELQDDDTFIIKPELAHHWSKSRPVHALYSPELSAEDIKMVNEMASEQPPTGSVA